MCVGFWTFFFSRPDSRSACLPVLVITVHVFIFIVFAWLTERLRYLFVTLDVTDITYTLFQGSDVLLNGV
jgi:hypothetical protein